MTQKKCSRCKQEKDYCCFSKSITNSLGLNSFCKICQSEYRKGWYAKNKDRLIKKACDFAKTDKGKEYNKKMYQKHKDKKDKSRKAYNQSPEGIKKRKDYWIKKTKDPSFRMAARLRNRIRKILKHKNINKIDKSFKLIGCSREDLKIYLESKFKDGMSWENYNKWHIDHIIPCSSFDLTKEEEQRKCFHYTNLQPLWASDNIRKSNKIL